jgi:hypothetical protein
MLISNQNQTTVPNTADPTKLHILVVCNVPMQHFNVIDWFFGV